MDGIITAVGKQYVLYIPCAFTLSQAVCKAHVLYHSFIFPLQVWTKFFTSSRKRHDLRGKVVAHRMSVLTFSTNLSQIFLVLRIIQRDVFIDVHGLVVFKKHELSRQIFEKYSTLKLNDNLSFESRVFSRRTDR